MITLVSTTGFTLTKYLPQFCNFLDPTSEAPGQVEANQLALDIITSDQDLSQMTECQSTAIGGENLDRNLNFSFYITGKVISQLKWGIFNFVAFRPPT